MSSNVERDGDPAPLVEPEGVNAGGPVDQGAGPAGGSPVEAARRDATGERDVPEQDDQGQGEGELLSRPGAHNGVTRRGPGQELSAEEG